MAKPKPIPSGALYAALAQSLDCSHAEAQRTFKAVQSTLQTILVGGQSVRLPAIGTLTVVDVPERQRHNPATGERFMAPAKRVVKYTASKILKDALAEKSE